MFLFILLTSFDTMKFSFFVLNVSSLSKHYVDLKDDMFAIRSDHVCIVETWIDPEKENKVSDVLNQIVEGDENLLKSNRFGLIVGFEFAKKIIAQI